VCSLGVNWFGRVSVLITCAGGRVICMLGVKWFSRVGLLIYMLWWV
jgi:hypothetical protein